MPLVPTVRKSTGDKPVQTDREVSQRCRIVKRYLGQGSRVWGQADRTTARPPASDPPVASIVPTDGESRLFAYV